MSFNPKTPGRAGPLPSSTLPGLITFLCSVDDVHSALASHQLVGAVARAQGFQRVADFHRRVPKKQPALGAGWKRSRDLCPIRGRRSSLKTNVPNVDNEFCNGLAFIGLLPLARFMLHGDGETGLAPFACRGRPGGRKPITVTARSSSIEASERRRFFAVLGAPPIMSPVDAVRAGIVQESRASK
jgi:hypothetical protein